MNVHSASYVKQLASVYKSMSLYCLTPLLRVRANASSSHTVYTRYGNSLAVSKPCMFSRIEMTRDMTEIPSW